MNPISRAQRRMLINRNFQTQEYDNSSRQVYNIENSLIDKGYVILCIGSIFTLVGYSGYGLSEIFSANNVVSRSFLTIANLAIIPFPIGLSFCIAGYCCRTYLNYTSSSALIESQQVILNPLLTIKYSVQGNKYRAENCEQRILILSKTTLNESQQENLNTIIENFSCFKQEYTCPLSMEWTEFPTRTNGSNTQIYELNAINHVKVTKGLNPITRRKITKLIPDNTMPEKIRRFEGELKKLEESLYIV